MMVRRKNAHVGFMSNKNIKLGRIHEVSGKDQEAATA